MTKKLSKIIFIPLMLVMFQPVWAGVSSSANMPEVKDIQHEWAKLYYLSEYVNNNYKELQALARQANHVAHDNPDSAEAWSGMRLY